MTAGGPAFEEDPKDPAPMLDGTAEANQTFTAWIARQMVGGRMDPRTADAFSTIAAKDQAAIRLKHGLHEMDELRKLVERQEAALREMDRRELEGRYTASDTAPATSTGRWRAPDGDAH